MSITTKDCIAALIKGQTGDLANPKYWKRVYKGRSEYVPTIMGYHPCDLREFRNTMDLTAFGIVWADDSTILEARVLHYAVNMRSVLASLIKAIDDFEDPSDVGLITWPFETLPYRKDINEDAPGEYETLDIENKEIMAITDSSIEFDMGGDWQIPCTVTFNLMDDGRLYCDHKETPIKEDQFGTADGISDTDLLAFAVEEKP